MPKARQRSTHDALISGAETRMTSITHQRSAAEASKFRILLTALLVSSLIMLDSNIVAVSLAAIGPSLGASFTDVPWVISAYVLTYASLLLASGS
jgi:hypothetical protein